MLKYEGTMKIAVAIVFVVALCSHVYEVTSAPSDSSALGGGSGGYGGGYGQAHEKPLSERIKERVDKVRHTAMLVKTVAHGLHSLRELKQHDSGSSASAGPSSEHMSNRDVKQIGANFAFIH
uniref:Uncharacterized protein n=1 Tax=Heliothis virescens TaxID=7102 RepID=A0A2A4K2H6_HELVI